MVSYISMTTEEAVAKYKKNYEEYVKLELVKVAKYREAYKHIKGSLADQVIERAIWYMEHGYSVYGHGLNSYHSDGVVDCSGFTKLVFGDFSFELTGVCKKYTDIGNKIEDVYTKRVDFSWSLDGVENLKPGDILTWWKGTSDRDFYIGHVGIYIGQLDGNPTVICTTAGTPTAIGIVSSFKRWYGEHFYNAQRILPEGSWTPKITIVGHDDKGPIIPKQYVLPPQKPIELPGSEI
jgi:hypothetical protein